MSRDVNFNMIVSYLRAAPLLIAIVLHSPALGEGTSEFSEIERQLTLDAGGKTEVVKNFPKGFASELTGRGEPLVYDAQNSHNFEYIGMPIGGIGAGQLYLGGDGKLWFWDIFNANFDKAQVKGIEAYKSPYRRSLANEKGSTDLLQGFEIEVATGNERVTKQLDRDWIREIKFLGQYPIGKINYSDPQLPVTIQLEAFSPFVPLDVDSSSLPATILNFRVTNSSTDPVDVKLAGWMENAVLHATRQESNSAGKLVNESRSFGLNGKQWLYSAMPGNSEVEEGQDQSLIATGRNRVRNWARDTVRAGGAREMSFDRLTSKPFTVSRPFLVFGANQQSSPGGTRVVVKVDGNVVGSAAVPSPGRHFHRRSIDLSQYVGKSAVIELVNPSRQTAAHLFEETLALVDHSDKAGPLTSARDFGTMTLSVDGTAGNSYVEGESRQEMSLRYAAKLVGTLGQSFQLRPGETQKVRFILTWHFPHTLAVAGNPETRWYAVRFEDAAEVSDYVASNYVQLADTTRLWRDTWYDSTLPYWFLDRTFLNTSILASNTSILIRDKLFYGHEGGYHANGTCNHVYGYVQAMGRLFPELEKGLREQVDFRPMSEGGALRDDGVIYQRWWTRSMELAVDGQCGCILRAYLCHQMSHDKAFLERIYPGLKLAMQGLTEARDDDQDGILTGPQFNTLDGTWYGKITWLSLHYTAALRATAEMADAMGDAEYADFCRKTADKGRDYIEKNLFNGEYFIQEADPDHPESPGTYTGLEYSQLFGQSWAYQVGLGEIIDSAKAKTALESMWRYNFTTDVGPFRKVHRGGRWYALPGEGGLIACTWPNGGSDVLNKGIAHFAAYNNECQAGYEYAATSLMMWHDMPYHSLAHIWFMHNDRYHGSKRNPWCEVEYGTHYARSMASYGHFIAACGFRYDGPKGFLAFAPQITPHDFKAAFTAAEGWGTLTQTRDDGMQVHRINLKHGSLRLETLEFEVVDDFEVSEIAVNAASDVNLVVAFEQNGDVVTITLETPTELTAGESLEVVLR